MKMRIVAMTCSEMWIQIFSYGIWKQEVLSTSDFLRFMEDHFSMLFNELRDDLDAYYNYGETEEMQRRGEAYIFNEVNY